MPLIETKGAASAQGFGEFAQQTAATYIEDVFSTWLYTGNGSTQTITNGIDLSGKGGLVWLKARTQQQSNETYGGHALYDTVRGATKQLSTSNAAAETTQSTGLTSFNSTGFNIGSLVRINNSSSYNYVSWSFRKQLKFFDVVTYTGNGIAGRTVAHNLGSVPGCIIIKQYSGTASYTVYHRSLGSTAFIQLDQDTAAITAYNPWNSTTPTASVFTLGTQSDVNDSGSTYVAYLFAHDAGGFGLSGTDNVISCGSYTGNGSTTGPTITLGYEPQWLMIKNTSGIGNWNMIDNMRGMSVGSADAFLEANTSDAEATADWVSPTATGFNIVSTSSQVNTNTSTYIYIAIRRGPMKTPTSGTSVYSPDFFGGGTVYYNSGFPTDLALTATLAGDTYNTSVADRLRGYNNTLVTSNTNAELADTTNFFDNMVGFGVAYTGGINTGFIGWLFRRAPKFFDVVCYTGTGTTQSVNHNLGVTPNLIIVKRRTSNGYEWVVQNSTTSYINLLFLNQDSGYQQDTTLLGVATSTTFEVRNNSGNTNSSGASYVAYLFASCPGVSKVGSYTSTGAAQTIDCGFTGGARFVLIKRTNNIGDWYVYDSARGISSGNDPYIFLNSTAAEVTGTNYVDTDSTGFKLGNNTPVNTNGGTYIFLAIA